MKISIRKLMVLFVLMTAALFAEEGAAPSGDGGQGPQAGAKAPDKPLTVEEIVEKANHMAYYQGDDGKSVVNMVITDKQDRTREREFVILRLDEEDGGDQYFYVYFQMPADVRKMVFMVHKYAEEGKDDDRWLYLPNLDLVKRISAGDKRTSFVGSDFLYEDVSGRGLWEDEHSLAEETDKYYVLKNVPKDPDKVEFKYYLVYVDKKTFLPMLMEYFDEKDNKYRTIESLEVEEIEKFPTVTKSRVTDMKRESTTEMTFSDIDYNIGLKKDIFTERYLRRPPREARR